MATYKDANKEFKTKYAKEIAGISKANGVDLGVGQSMFEANLDNSGKGVEAYKGGGVATNWGEMVSDYKNLKTAASVDAGSKSKSKSSGGSINVGGTSQMKGSGQTSGSGGGSNIGDFYKQASEDFLDAQTANFDKQLSQQIASLEASYAEAISQGKISVRDAEAQFTAQKGEIEKQAYINNESMKVHAQQRGIQNSQQLIGLEQGANSRTTSAITGNISERDKRVNDIKDRITALTTQKDLAIGSAQADHGYNIASAQAQASQMYNQSMGGFMQEDYFTDKTQTNTERNMAIQQGYGKENMAIEQGYNKENMAIEQGYRKELSEFQNTLDISKMWVGHDINLKEFDAQLQNQFAIIDKNFGIDMKMESIRSSNAMKQISASASASAKAVTDEYQIAMDREARKLGLTGNYNEKTISDALKAEGKQDLIDEMNMKRDAGIKDAIAQAGVQREMEILQNPNRYINPKAPKDYTANQPLGGFDPVGNVLNLFTGYGKDTKTYKEQLAIKAEAEKKAKAIEKKYSMTK